MMRATATKEAVPFVERLVFYSRANRYYTLSRLWKCGSVEVYLRYYLVGL